MIRIIRQIPLLRLFRTIGKPKCLPVSLTISPSFKCNSRCMTCNVYKKESDELSLNQWKSVFYSLGRAPFWVTISGGEPFLNMNLFDITVNLYDICRPSIINIPTNGILVNRIPGIVNAIAAYCRDTNIVINVSIDDIGKRNDSIRGVKQSFDKALSTFKKLKQLHMDNVSVGIHTVISRYNVNRIPEIYETLKALGPDSYITEIAEERVELDTVGSKITPDRSQYEKSADFLIKQLRQERFSKLGKITRIFRIEYYNLVKKILAEKRQLIPCYAGFASAHIAPDGDVWMCCVRAESIGNLVGADYNFKEVWFGEKAREIRKSIKAGECHCPLANAAYTNMLHSGRSLFQVGRNFF